MTRKLTFFLLTYLSLFFPLHVLAETDNIRYFGYYWGMDDFSQVNDHVNAMFINNLYLSTDINTLAALDIKDLETLSLGGAKGIVNVSSVLFNLSSNKLYPDYGARWNAYWKLLYPHLGKVLAFYPMDEPDLSIDAAEYALATHLIKINSDALPNPIPVMEVLSPSGVVKLKNGLLTIPPSVSWLGFDEYRCWGNECFGSLSINEKFSLVKDVMQQRGGKVFIIPEAYKSGLDAADDNFQTKLSQNASLYYELCRTTAECIGIFPFVLSNLPRANGGQGFLGSISMPILHAKFIEIGTKITRNNPVLPISPGDLNGDGRVNLADYNLLVSKFGTTYTLADYNSLVANFGT